MFRMKNSLLIGFLFYVYRMLYAFVQKQRASNSPHELNITYFIGGRCVADEETVSYLNLS